MAKVIAEQEYSDRTWVVWLRTIAIGGALGLIFWILTSLLANYVIEPLACRDLTNASVCSNASSLSGNIATIFTGLIGVIVMVRMGIYRPIILAIASAALLWNLAALTQGLHWAETIAWSIASYALTYGLFAWIARYALLWAVIVLSVLIVLIVRIALVL